MAVRKYLVIRGEFSWERLDEILGRPDTDLQERVDVRRQPCGLAPGALGYKIYYAWKNDVGGVSAHVVLHSNGVCFSGSLDLDCDWNYAEELYFKWNCAVKELSE